jgi:hypothetical protein
VEVRRAGLDDPDAVADVFIPSFESLTFLPTLHTHDEHRAFIRDRISDSEVWLAEADGRVVGMGPRSSSAGTSTRRGARPA